MPTKILQVWLAVLIRYNKNKLGIKEAIVTMWLTQKHDEKRSKKEKKHEIDR